MDPLGKIMQPNGAPAAPPPMTNGAGFGGMMQPQPQQETPVPPNSPEFQQRVNRNKSFLQQPEVSAALLQFGMSLMGGADVGSALSEGIGAAGTYATNAEALTKDQFDMQMKQEENRRQNIELGLTIEKTDSEIKKAGQRRYTKMVSGESPLGIELGLQKGERSQVEFTEDQHGNIINADVKANPVDSTVGGKGTQVSQLLNEADAAELAGDTERASLLRTAARKQASGVSTQLTLKPGQATKMVNGVETVYDLPGSEGALKAAAEEKAQGSKRIQEVQTGINVRRAVDKSLNLINNTTLNPNLTMTGLGSYIASIRGTPANDLAMALDTVKANLGFMKLQDIRDAATKTGGGLGPVSDFENRLLQATVANLDQSQTGAALVDNLMYVKAIFTDVQYDGKLSEIGQRLQNGEINEAQAVNEAGMYLDKTVSDLKAAQTGANKDLGGAPPPIMPPKGGENSYHGLTLEKQQRMDYLLKKKNEK